MASEKAPRLERGEFRPPGANDLRCPCPIMNSLANHGLIARDGRNITKAELKSALQYLGAGIDVATGLVSLSFMVHCDDPDNAPPGTARGGLRDSTDINEAGEPVLSLDKVGRRHSIEHDVSLTREDRALGDYSHLDLDLYRQLVNYTRQQGGLWIPQWGRYRRIRFKE